MSFVSKLLRTMEHTVTAEHFSNVAPKFTGQFSAQEGETVTLDLKKSTSINLIALYEKGERITEYSIYAKDGEDFRLIYKQNRIGRLRLCAIDPIKTTTLQIKIEKTRKAGKAQINVEVFDMPKANRPFRKTAYLEVGTLDTDGKIMENITHYNHFNLICGAYMSPQGEVYIKESNKKLSYDEYIKNYISIIREKNPTAEIVQTMLVHEKADYIKAVQHPKTVESIAKFVKEYGLDGVSFDWEYPTMGEWKVFDKFLIALKKALGDKLLTLALASWLRYNFSQEALQSIDVAEVMTYDNMPRDIDGHHSQFFCDGPNAILHFLKKGFRLEQLNLGIPFYARPVDGSGYWSNYCDEISKMSRFKNIVADANYTDNATKKKFTKPSFFNGYQMVCDKTAYALYSGISGVMVWHFKTDVPYSEELSLTKAINETLSARNKK